MKVLPFLALSAFITPLASAQIRGGLPSSAPSFDQQTLWKSGDGGYKMYRIPGIVVTEKGTIIAYAEARKYTGSDWDSIDIVMRRSTDGGKTFSPPRFIAHAPNVPRSPVAIERKQAKPSDTTYNNPVAIADRDGTLHFLFCREYMRVFYMRSEDDGLTFSAPVDITAAFDSLRSAYPWRVIATGPGHGIQLKNGRLVVPIWLALGTGGNGHQPSENATVFSDDHGTTWHAGEIAVKNTPETPNPNETTAVQLAGGAVMLNVRTASPRNRRLIVTSKDGARNWSHPHYQEDLPDSICFASILRLSTRKHGGRNRILFSAPDNLTRADGKQIVSKDRKNLTVRVSYDEGKSWTLKRAIDLGPSGYSDLAAATDGTIYCLYEAGGSFPHERLVLARFNLTWLTHGSDSYKGMRK